MRVSTTLFLALPILITAQQQKPLLDTLQEQASSYLGQAQLYFEKAKSYVPGAIQSPINTGTANIAAKNVTPLTKENWYQTLKSSTSATSQGPSTWMVFVSGGNKTCYGQCDGVERAWSESATLFAADPNAPHLGYINCDSEAIMCGIWAAGPPAIWYIQLPVVGKDQSTPATTIHIVSLNTTTTTAKEIVQIHTQKAYEKTPVYEGAFHPFDGWLAQFGLNTVLAYVVTVFGLIPSWAFMIIISFVSRNVM